MSVRQPKRRRRVVMVGAFPPPVHGMAAANAAVRDHFEAAGATTSVIDVSASTLARSLPSRLERLPRIARAVLVLLLGQHQSGDPLYMSVSGGLGQLYEIVFVLCARLRGLRVYLHHHSFAYLDSLSPVSWLLVRVAGRSAVHIALSRHMAERLTWLYHARRAVPISNTVFVARPASGRCTNGMRLETVGFMSNLSLDKGVFEFFDLTTLMRSSGLRVHAVLAGPFQDARTEQLARARLSQTQVVEYVGPQHGEGKEAFFSRIDVFIFPTLYRNEAEPIVIHEAMSRGIPVIAYGRGCIPEMISPDAGLVIDPGVPFGPPALARIQEWICSPESYQRASRAARLQFASCLADGTRLWQSLLLEILEIDKEPVQESTPQRQAATVDG